MQMKYVLYFIAGGALISLVTYYASNARSLLAAFLANLPVMTFITFLTIYHEAGEKVVVPYAKGLLIMLFPWLTYIFAVILLTPRMGLIPSLAAGVASYFVFAYLILRRF